MKLPNLNSAPQRLASNFLRNLTFCFFIVLTNNSKAQASFNITHTLCAGNTVSVIALSGTLTANAYTWTSANSGPFFSSPNASVCDIYFPAPGVYTINLGITGGATTSTSSETVAVFPLPVLTLTSSASPICVNDGATLTASGAVSYSWNPLGGLYFLSNLHDAAYVTPPVTTGYTVTGTSSMGCQSSAAFTITVDPSPNLVISANTTTICEGSYATLTGLGASNYTWTSTTFSAPVAQTTVSAGPGNYTLVGANGNCKDTIAITINLVPNLIINVTSSRLTICKDDGDSIVPVILNATGATSYTWEPYQPGRMTYSIGPSTGVSPSLSTQYTVTGGTGFCSGKSVIAVQIITCTGLEEKASQNSLSVFPNPAQDRLFIRSSFQGIATLKVMNLTGELVLQVGKEMNGELQSISIQDLPAGIYLISFEAKGQTPHLVRVIKQ